MAVMNVKELARASLLAVLAAVPLSLFLSKPAEAQWVVVDPSNLVENTLNELNTLQTQLNTVQIQVNQATQIANQVTQLAHETTNLVNLPTSMVNQLLSAYMNAYRSLNQTWTSINGFASNLQNMVNRYEAMFPNRQGSSSGTLTPTMALQQTQGFLTQVRNDLQGVGKMVAQVSQQMPQTQANLQTAVQALNSSTGADSSIQSTGQIEAVVAQQIAQTNSLILAMNQAQLSMMAQQTQDRDDAAKRHSDLTVHMAAAPASPVPYVP
jgi:P-type conjugative transfer protein TrbJ